MTWMPRVQKKVQVWVFDQARGQKLRVLLLKVVAERGANWQPVTGSVEKNETTEQAAKREVIEETGLRFEPFLLSLGLEFEFDGRWGRVSEEAYAWQIVSEQAGQAPHPKLDPHEHTAFEWCDADTALNRVPHATQRQALRALLKLLG